MSGGTETDRNESQRPLHKPVLLREVLDWLALQPGLIVVDGTVGAGGHSRQILKQIGPKGRLIGLDRDAGMLQHAAKSLSGSNCILRHASYAELPHVLEELEITAVDRVLLDLGVSSDQLADARRGFGIEAGGPLDLRFDVSQGEPAWQLLDRLSETELADVLQRFGEERFSRAIAKRIIARRGTEPIRSAEDLVRVVAESVPKEQQRRARTHPATRVFQALRIAVNDELGQLERALAGDLHKSLKPGGRAVIITFHSLEDRIVKKAFREKTRWENLTPKPITASSTERKMNPRCRSAKLRAARKS